MRAAATPDSNAPSSFDAPMKTPSTAFTRPRSAFGVASATVVARMFIEIMSAKPLTALRQSMLSSGLTVPTICVNHSRAATGLSPMAYSRRP